MHSWAGRGCCVEKAEVEAPGTGEELRSGEDDDVDAAGPGENLQVEMVFRDCDCEGLVVTRAPKKKSPSSDGIGDREGLKAEKPNDWSSFE